MMSNRAPRIPQKPPRQQQTPRDLASTESDAFFDRKTKTLTVPPGVMGIVLTESRRGGVKIAQFAETSSLKDSGLAVGMRILSISKGGSKITVDLSEATLEEVQQLISDWKGYTKIFTLDTRTVRRRMGGGNSTVGWRKAHADRLDDVSEVAVPQTSLSLDTP